MKVDEKYLPEITNRREFLENRINASKEQVFGGQLEVLAAEANGEKRTVTTTEDAMQQIITNIDILEKELAKLK